MKYFSILLFSALAAVAFGQSGGCAQIVYECRTTLAKGPVHDGRNTLHFDAEKGIFIHDDFPKEDVYSEIGSGTRYTKGDPEGLPVFIHLKDAYLCYKSEYAAPPGQLFIFRDTLPRIRWHIRDETKQIGPFHCAAASGMFAGRIYDVWFTPEIPVGLGPYKLCGLPGMILEAASRDGKVRYDFAAYHPTCTRTIARPAVGKEMSWPDFEVFVINKLLQTESLSMPGVVITNDDPDADYEIEREKFTIIRQYKAKRNGRK